VLSIVGMNMEGLHRVGDIFIKISVNCVLNYVLYFFYVFIFMGFSCV
jgi:hypothetical protein